MPQPRVLKRPKEEPSEEQKHLVCIAAAVLSVRTDRPARRRPAALDRPGTPGGAGAADAGGAL
jgi:hypothetical protein